MAYCNKCGANIIDGAKFCPACGAAVGESGSNQAPPPNYNQPPPPGGSQYQSPPPGYNQYPPASVDYSNPAADANANKVYGILAYIGLLVLVSIFAAPKESRYSRYHANQGLVLLIAAVGAGIAIGITILIITAIAAAGSGFTYALAVPLFGIGILNSGLRLLYFAACITFMVLGIVNAAKGECRPLPVIGRITILK